MAECDLPKVETRVRFPSPAPMESLESLPMRKEPIFDAGGTYQHIVDKNICFHKEAIEKVFEIITSHFTKIKPLQTPQILDLACGGKPVIFSEIMRRLPSRHFVYTGIDLNRDQVDACKQYPFSKNVTACAMEGNIWELNELSLNRDFDIIFMGLNAHHAVPEEIFYAAKDIHKLLKPNGIFLNHDLFRPAQYPYLRRPKSMQFVSKEKLAKANIKTPLSPNFVGETHSNWRGEWFLRHRAYLQNSGVGLEAANLGIEHMKNRDYPVSAEEMGAILKKADFKVEIHYYKNTNYPPPQFFGLVAGYKK